MRLVLCWARLLSAIWALCALPQLACSEEGPAIAAASDLQFALTDIAAAFEKEGSGKVRLVFGSSGNFARQIEQKAPFQLFLSADEAFVLDLAAKGLMKDRGNLYAVGRIVLFAPKGSPLAGDLSADGLRKAIASGALKHFSIANPEHAPYGRAAQEWLVKRGLWEDVRPFLVLGENASQAAQFATTGDSDGGIIPYSLVLAPRVGEKGTFVLLSDKEHGPLRQRMALVRGASATAEAFYAYMQRRPAREVMRRYGFVLPDEPQ